MGCGQAHQCRRGLMGSQEANCPMGEIDPLASPTGVPLMEVKKFNDST